VSLTFASVSIDGGSTVGGWKNIGYNLDGKCTTAASTDVCARVSGASGSVQVDGTGGIDNSYGENVCPVFGAVSGTASCSSALTTVYLVTDSTGAGTLAMQSSGSWLILPVHDVWVSSASGSGTMGGVIPTMGMVSAFQAVAGHISTSLCSGSVFMSIATQLEQASDILPDGSNDPASTCAAISIGMQFTGATTYSGPLPVETNPCVSD
jgi:hypothetical protein